MHLPYHRTVLSCGGFQYFWRGRKFGVVVTAVAEGLGLGKILGRNERSISPGSVLEVSRSRSRSHSLVVKFCIGCTKAECGGGRTSFYHSVYSKPPC